MQYRKFGNTGTKISALGFGCMRFPEFEKDGVWYIDEEKTIPMLRSAYERGVNYFDTAFHYNHDNSPITLGKAFKDIREKVYLTNKIPLFDENFKTGDYRRLLEICLKRMDTDYIDFNHFWGINKDYFDNKIIKLDLLNEAVKAKEEGLIRHISFSFHDKPENLKYIIDKGEMFETVLLQYNLLDRSNEDAIDYAAQKGLGVVAMGPVAGGRLAAPARLYKEVSGKQSTATYELALRFVLGNKNISCALSGMENMDNLNKNIEVVENESPLTQDEIKKISIAMEDMKKFSDLYCTGCNYCQPCPAKINIPSIFNFYTFHNVYGLSQTAKNDFIWYKQDSKNATISSCTDCGVCEQKCPQKIKIRSELKRVEEILNNL